MATEYGMPIMLFKHDANGNVIYWSIATNGVYDRITYGRFPVVDSSDIPVIINPHTKTSYSSAIKRKKDRGYKSQEDLNITDDMYESANQLRDLVDEKLPKFSTDASNVIKPMKCQKFRLNTFKYNPKGDIAQPKINGVRCTVIYEEVDNGLFGKSYQVVLKSKEGLIYNIDHIENAFSMLVYSNSANRNIVFDGEIYCKGYKNTEIGGAARNSKNPLHKHLQFVCFDLSIPDLSNIDREHVRDKILGEALVLAQTNHPQSKLVYYQTNPGQHEESKDYSIVHLCSNFVYKDSEVEAYRDLCINLGYEGCVVRSRDEEYKFGSRPVTMMKAKACEEGEFLCLDILIDEITKEIRGKSITTPYAKFVCRNDLNDETFEVKPTAVYNGVIDEHMTSSYILTHRNEFIGKMLAIKFYERTNKKIPFNANAFGVRDYEEE